MAQRLAELSTGFRARYLGYEELTRQLRSWAESFPEVVRLVSIGQSGEGRELWQLVIGRDPDRIRPSVWIDGNMHASELAGSSAALAIAEDVIALHLDPDNRLHALPEHVREIVREVVFYVLPRMSPDGAEAVLTTGRWVRSVPRDPRAGSVTPRWVSADLDGDGRTLLMRQRDPAGDYVECDEAPGWLFPRRLEDAGPYYRLYPEGTIAEFDGHFVPDPHFLSDNSPDLNRNFPFQWMPEPNQVGAGAFPGSEPESRAVIERANALPQLFAWLNFHTFGGVFIRPLGNEPDKKMHPEDRALFRQIGAWAEELTGYPMVSGYEEFTYTEDQQLHGDLSDYAFHQRGCIAYACELWDLFRRIGMERTKRFCDQYTHLTRRDLVSLASFDKEKNGGRIGAAWKPFQHPQLGAVEVGGFDPRIGVWNPPESELLAICEAQSATFLRVAALAPRVELTTSLESLGDDAASLSVVVENLGYLPTYVLASQKHLPHNEELWLEVEPGPGVRVQGERRVRLGHLEGWGRGLFGPASGLHISRSRGTTHRARVEILLRGRGPVVVRVRSARTGTLTRNLVVG
jgi:hypothetical protein